MPYPAGVITRQVIFDPIDRLSGQPAAGQIQIEITMSLKWTATGDVILATPETALIDQSTGLATFTLPIVQQGFVAGDTGAVVETFKYKLTPILTPQAPVVTPLYLELGYGDGSPLHVDFMAPDPSDNGGVLTLSGAPGPVGPVGPPGAAAPLPVPAADITTLAPGASATVSVDPGFQFHFGVPQGAPGVNGSGQGVPTGGTTGQVLTKNSSTDYDAAWANNAAQGIPAGGTINQILAKIDGTDYNTHWVPVPVALPNGGTTGQVLSKNSGTDGDAGWSSLPTIRNLPAGGTAGQTLKKNSSTDGDASWVTPTSDYSTMPAGTLIVVQTTTSTWPNSGARPHARTDCPVQWIGPSAAGNPAGMINGDIRSVTP